MGNRRIVTISLFVLFAMISFFLTYLQTMPSLDAPKAKQGVLDLSAWDFEKQGVVNLDGEWEFYAGELLEPAEISAKKQAYLAVPGVWDEAKNKVSRIGIGTYRLKVIAPQADEVLGLKLRSIRMSHKLFINGKPEGASGSPDASQLLHTPGNTPYTVFFAHKLSQIEIVVQVANYVYANGGLVTSLQLGPHVEITRLNSIQIGTDVAIVLILAIFGIYHMSFYFLGRKEKAYMLSGVYLLVLMMHQLLVGEKLLMRLFPGIPFDISYKLLDISEFASGMIIVLFLTSIHSGLLTQRRMVLLLVPHTAYILAVLALPYRQHTEIKPVFLLYLALMSVYLLGRMLVLLSRNKSGSADRMELGMFIGGIIALTVYMLDNILYTTGVVPTDLLSKLGVVAFIMFINLFLAVRFANAYEKAEALSHQLLLTNQLKDEFLTYTSHEIKTPLHGIMNMTAHLLEDEERNLTPRQQQHLWLIKDTSFKLSMLIHDLLDVTRLKHGELRLHWAVVDVRMLVQMVFDVLRFELPGKQIVLDNDVPAEVWVRADENRLRQIVYNLVHNAIKHTEKGTIVVRTELSAGMVAIEVKDTGTGIPKDKHEAIFNYFEQLDAVRPQDGYTGMGVGLYISRKLVEQMGGEIGVRWSVPGVGTSMRFTLPRAEQAPDALKEAASAVETPRVPSEAWPAEPADSQGQTILVVDDEAANIHILLHALRRYKYNVLTAFSAKEALEKFSTYRRIDLVILDVMMPVTSGIELCQMLRSQYSIIELPILFATAKDTPQEISMGFRAGANDYITKPFDMETLIARIQTQLTVKNAIHEAVRSEQAFYQVQIKPHFLYNALSSVISFCYTDGPKAAHLLGMLSKYLRYILDTDRSASLTSLYREMELTKAYVEIEKARFGDRFTFESYVDEHVLNHLVPSLCIQPFVENAIRHGLFEKEGDGKVWLTVSEGNGYLKVTIEDNGIGIPDDLLYRMTKGESAGGGIGIVNIRKRLDAIEGATLNIASELGRGTRISMYLPVAPESSVT